MAYQDGRLPEGFVVIDNDAVPLSYWRSPGSLCGEGGVVPAPVSSDDPLGWGTWEPIASRPQALLTDHHIDWAAIPLETWPRQRT